MRRAAWLLCLLACTAPARAVEIAAIAYHDIVVTRSADPYAVTLEDFERQMAYLKRAGYHPVSLRALDDARKRGGALPDKPVLLTFDDGLKSYWQHAYPVLRRYGYPSVVSVVTSWIDGRARPADHHGGFMTWDELRELARAGDVEVLSHTDDLHRALPANSFGSELPAATARIYDHGYEAEADHARRVRRDLARSVERLRAELGRAPVGITWPYGEYDATLVEAAAELGMEYHLALSLQPTQFEALPRVNRIALKHYRTLADFADALTHKAHRRQQLRFVELELDAFRGTDRAAQERVLSRLLTRLEVLRVNAVLINPFTADGRRAYFHNTAVPVEADVLSRVTQQLTRRTGLAHVYVRVPATASAALYTDLARLNWFNGAVLEGAAAPGQIEAARALLRRYRPDVRVGTDGDTVTAGVDFHVSQLPADTAPATLTRRAAAVLRADPAPLFLLKRSETTNERTLRAAMQALRAAGAVHYGYGPDNAPENMPSVLGIVGALHEHTVAGARQ